ncbi:MAG: hypothetical protein O3B01_17380 [Planctomycetota bacterium]|nr:hypothetical protein [Planctomycetota bacterium]MDA1140348.1 hypothetical protein [Planctomycetota bacterium]
MEESALAILKADLGSQLQLIRDIYSKLDDRKNGTEHDPIRLEAMCYQLHNLFCAFEDAFKIIAERFENQVEEASHWYAEFLKRMKAEIQGVRPAVLSEESYELLDEMRAFRHVFRHAYGKELDYAKAVVALNKAELLRNRHAGEFQEFLGKLGVTKT